MNKFSQVFPDASVLAPPFPESADEPLRWRKLYGGAPALALTALAARRGGLLVAVSEDARQMQNLADELRFFGGDSALEVITFPDWECLPYDNFSPHPDIISQRLRVLHRAPQLGPAVVVILLTLANLMQRLPPKEFIAGHLFALRKGERLDLAAFREKLARASYAAVSQVMAPGEFALRGGVLDVYPMGAARPFRLDLFDDEIESIRLIDPETQRSVSEVGDITLFPAREFPMTEDGVNTFRGNFRKRFAVDPRTQRIYRDISKGEVPPGAEFFLPLFFSSTGDFFDYLPAAAGLLLPPEIENLAARHRAEVEERFSRCAVDTERLVLPPEDLYLSPAGLMRRIKNHPRAYSGGGDGGLPEKAKDIYFDSRPPPDAQAVAVNRALEHPYSALCETLAQKKKRGEAVLLVTESGGRREMLQEVLADYGHRAEPVAGWKIFAENPARFPLAVAAAPLARGLYLAGGATVLSEAQLYGEAPARRERGKTGHGSRDPEAVIKSLVELSIGDPVVHEEHGVGRYQGLSVLSSGGVDTEFLAITYHGGDKLYVPVLSLHLVTRYVGADAESAPLHKLGHDAWDKARRKARRKTFDVAAELLETQALRAKRSGAPCTLSASQHTAYAEFAGRFAFEETPDQLRVEKEVLEEMLSGKPMDKLVCGDVGFGKTEIALRAAFVAVHNNRQAAVLAPTTLLARQHFETFRERFAGSGAEVELLSRFRTAAETKNITARLAEGRPDIVIGTHKLLQKNVRFKNLGLLILDEEHRFGVRQKERLKQLRSEVDILTLSATPIPRTLNMAIVGLRSVSLITTPPRARLSIKTFVRNFDHGLIREACLREIRRGGQVYFLHNEVHSMERIAGELAELLPEAAIATAHGRQPARQLENTMQNFYRGRHQILVCSTIIESGLDVPNANTIIINRADRFGLAQLHQLRGRVGRSHHQAYAYFLVHNREHLRGDARKRLDVIASLDELGVGFALASHDLEIRGAGELLGEAQSGAIDEVGFTLYSEYLRQAVAWLSQHGDGERESDAGDAEPSAAKPDVQLHVCALFPQDYLPDVHHRLVMYKRIAGAADDDALYELQVEMIDRFGLLPAAGKALFNLAAIKLNATRLGLRAISLGKNGGRITFSETTSCPPQKIAALLGTRQDLRMENPLTLRISQAPEDEGERLAFVEKLLAELGE